MQQSLWLQRQETQALCNSTYGISGLLALTHTLLARTRNGATAALPPLQLSPPSPAPAAAPLHGAGSSQPCWAQTTWAGLSLLSPGQRQAGTTRGDPSSAWLSPGGESGTCQGCTKRFAMKCVERLKQFRDVSKPFSTEPGLAGTSQCLCHGPGPAGAPCPSAEHLSQQARPGNGTGAPRPLYLSDLTLYLSTR